MREDSQGDLGTDVEAELYAIQLDVPAADREAAVAALIEAQPERSTLIRELWAHLSRADRALDGVATAAAAIVERIGPYRIVEKLGEGGFGIVWLALQEEPLRRCVAIKVLHPGMHSEQVLRRFEIERQALARMNHPFVTAVFDAGTTDEQLPYFVMEYVDGRHVTTFCEQQALDLLARLELFLSICRAVEHAHQHGILHRDLKPANILVRLQDGRPLPKVIDFGIAKALDEPLADASVHTQQGRMIGTPEYVAPEQAADGASDVDTRADIYSLGVVLYELLTGELPIARDVVRSATPAELATVLRDARVSRPSTRIAASTEPRAPHRPGPAQLRGDLDWITMRALAREADERYGSVGELAADVRRFLAHEPVSAGPPTVRYVVGKLLRRHRGFVAVAALVLVGLIGWVVTASVLWTRAEDRERRAQANLRDYEGLADLLAVEELRAAVPELWPALPRRIPDFEDWLRRADRLDDRLPTHRASHDQVEATRGHAGADGAVTFDRASDRFLWLSLARLIAEIEALVDTERGAIVDVRERLTAARTIRARSVEAYADTWSVAIESIAAHPDYDGLRIEPQVGLVPLGPDPDSGLEEFAHVATGAVPRRGDDGHLEIDESTGLVFTLLPGGSATIGAQADDATGRHHVGWFPRDDAEPVHTVELDPFLVSKFEMTQAQWERWRGENPSRYRAGQAVRSRTGAVLQTVSGLHPVESISGLAALDCMRQLGLGLPTEVQWEYAARGDTDTPWSTGATIDSLAGHANLADVNHRAFLQPVRVATEFADDWACHGPVDADVANPFGLHGTIGNVSEWCRDIYVDYGVAARPGDGLRDDGEPPADRNGVFRGGSFGTNPPAATSAMRYEIARGRSASMLGLRPIRTLDRGR